MKAVFMDPPENLNRADEENFRNKRDIGAKGSFMEAFKSLERKGKSTTGATAKGVVGSASGDKVKEKEETSAAARTAARKAEREARRNK